MSVNADIEDFSFVLFAKLWTRDHFTIFADVVPEYPTVSNALVPDSYCDTVDVFRNLGAAFYAEKCRTDYGSFGNSRSGFLDYLDGAAESLIELLIDVVPFYTMTAVVAAVALEMGYACSRRNNQAFILSCPLAFAMVIEMRFQVFYEPHGWRIIHDAVQDLNFALVIARYVQRSSTMRRYVLYCFQLLRFHLQEDCPEVLSRMLENVITSGGAMDSPSDTFCRKFRAAVVFPLYVQYVHQEFLSYMRPLFSKKFALKYDYAKHLLLYDMACICNIADANKTNFVLEYNSAVVDVLNECPDDALLVDEGSDTEETSDNNPLSSEMRGLWANDDGNPLEKCSQLDSHAASGGGSLESNDTQKSRLSVFQNLTTKSQPIDEVCDELPPSRSRPSVIQHTSRITSSSKTDEVHDDADPTTNIDRKDALTSREPDTEVACTEMRESTNRSLDNVVTPHFQSDQKQTHGHGSDSLYIVEKPEEISLVKIPEYVNPPPYELTALYQPLCDPGA